VKSLKTLAEHGDEDTIWTMASYLKDHAERAGAASKVCIPFEDNEEYTLSHDLRLKRGLEQAGYKPEKLDEYNCSVQVEAWNFYPPSQTMHTEFEWRQKYLKCQRRDPSMLERFFPITVILSFEQEDSVGVCLAALEVLGHVAAGTGNRIAVIAIGNCLEDDNREVQWKAVEQLSAVIRTGDQFGIAAAKKRLTHPDRSIRWAAQEALGQCNDRAEGLIKDKRGTSDSFYICT